MKLAETSEIGSFRITDDGNERDIDEIHEMLKEYIRLTITDLNGCGYDFHNSLYPLSLPIHLREGGMEILGQYTRFSPENAKNKAENGSFSALFVLQRRN